MTNSRQEVAVDWTSPPGRPDWLLGSGAVPAERLVVGVAAAVSVAALVAVAAVHDVAWSWWQWALVLAVTVDVAGGVPANALGSAKRFYHSPVPPGIGLMQRVLRSHVGFAFLHVHPFLLAALLPDATWGWAGAWYLLSLGGTAAVVAAPLYLRRPLAAAVVTVALVAAPLVDAPAGLAWFGPVLVLKLVAAHAVREEPYRPAAAPAGSGHPETGRRLDGGVDVTRENRTPSTAHAAAAWELTAAGDDGYEELVRVPDLSVGVYRIPAGGEDPQRPHTEDEVYTVLSGRAAIEVDGDRVPVRTGSVVFVPAGVPHRFVEITEHLCVVVAFGPAERSRAAGALDGGPRP